MLQAARTADVVVLNFHHLFDDEIREQLYQSLGIESPKDVLLLIDEAHNVGDVVQEIQSVECDAGTIDQAGHELAGLRRYQSSAGAVIELLPRIDRFIQGLSASPEIDGLVRPRTLFTDGTSRHRSTRRPDRWWTTSPRSAISSGRRASRPATSRRRRSSA